MSWERTGPRQGRLVCGGPRAADGYGCGAKSKSYPITSPAAPELAICEQAKADGWAFDVGFFAMALGHTTLCPGCLK